MQREGFMSLVQEITDTYEEMEGITGEDNKFIKEVLKQFTNKESVRELEKHSFSNLQLPSREPINKTIIHRQRTV